MFVSMERSDLQALVDRDLSTRQIAEAVGKSQTTVQYWLRRHGLRTSDVARLRRRRAVELEATCRVHGDTAHVVDRDGTPRCLRCRSESVSRWRRRAKLRLLAEAGGACVACGFDRWPAALHFHHVDPTTKAFGIAAGGMSRSYDVLRAEAAKCVVLCANCHAAVEAGSLELPGVDSNH